MKGPGEALRPRLIERMFKGYPIHETGDPAEKGCRDKADTGRLLRQKTEERPQRMPQGEAPRERLQPGSGAKQTDSPPPAPVGSALQRPGPSELSAR